jgi:hypothetical protein
MWKKLIFFAFIALLALVALEVTGTWYVSRVLGRVPEKKFRFNSYRVFEHAPGYREGPLADGTYRMTIDAQGFRRRADVEKKKPSNVYRIFLLGGSAAHGLSSAPPFPVRHLSDTETIDAVLERRLAGENTGFTRVEVINAAVTAYRVFQHTAYLESEILDYHPDLVIFFDGANDHFTGNADLRYLLDYPFQFWRPRLQEPSLGGALTYTANWLADYSGACRAFIVWRARRDAREQKNRADLYVDFRREADAIAAHEAAAPKQFLRSMHMNLDLLGREGVPAILCLQPMLALRDRTLRSAEEEALRWSDRNVQVLYPVVRDEVARVATEHDVPFVDMNPVSNAGDLKGRQFFIDDCHLTPLGAERCARALLPVVRAAIARAAARDGYRAPSPSDAVAGAPAR